MIAAAVLAVGAAMALPALADTGGSGTGAGSGSGSDRAPEPDKTPSERLADARDMFQRGEYSKAIPPLNFLLHPEVQLARTRDTVEARLLLGVCLFETGNRKGSATEFEDALRADDKASLDENLFSSEVRDYFDEIKKAKQARDQAAEDARKAAEDKEKLRKALEGLHYVEKRAWWVNLMPFGAGQFQNGDTRKGVFFAATEGVAAATSATIFIYLVQKYGYGGQVPKADAADARLLQQVAIGADVVFYGVAIWGIVDAFRHYKGNVELDRSSIPPDLLPDTEPTQKTKPQPKKKSSFLLLPTPIEHGAGAVLTWEF